MAGQNLRVAADCLQREAPKASFAAKPALDDRAGRDPVLAHAIAMARDGDVDGMRYLYLRFADNVYGYVCSLVRDPHEAEDITQQLFLKLISALQRYEPRGAPFSAWMLRLAHNLAMDHLRAPSRRMIPCEEVRPTDDVEQEDPDEPRRCLQAALRSCPTTSETCSCCGTWLACLRARSRTS